MSANNAEFEGLWVVNNYGGSSPTLSSNEDDNAVAIFQNDSSGTGEDADLYIVSDQNATGAIYFGSVSNGVGQGGIEFNRVRRFQGLIVKCI